MSHGDRLDALPAGFTPSATRRLAALRGRRRGAANLRHPVPPGGRAHAAGAEILEAFLFDVAGLAADLDAGVVRRRGRRRGAREGGPDGPRHPRPLGRRRLVGRGRRSASSALGDRLTCIFVDNGLLRQRRGESVVRMFRDHFSLDLVARRRAGALPRASSRA